MTCQNPTLTDPFELLFEKNTGTFFACQEKKDAENFFFALRFAFFDIMRYKICPGISMEGYSLKI